MTRKPNDGVREGILRQLRPWLTLPEAASLLSHLFDSEVSVPEVLQFGLQRQLTLSVQFPNHALGRRYSDPRVRLEQEYHQYQAANRGESPQSVPAEVEAAASTADDPTEVLRGGVYDLPLVGGERLDVEQEYQRLTEGPQVSLAAFDGAFVDSAEGVRFQLMREVGRDGLGAEPQLPYYLEPDVEPYALERQYEHLRRLPGDSVLVVRTPELVAFQGRAREGLGRPSNQLDRPLGERERATLLTIIAALARHANIDVTRTSKAAQIIESLTSDLGAKIPARTAEEHLKRIEDALERRTPSSS